MLRLRAPLVVGVVMFVGLCSRPASGQLAYLWTFDELTRRADCVVIAEAGETHSSGRTVVDPTATPAFFPFLEVDTSFDVRTVLKPCGRDVGILRTIRLRHFALDPQRPLSRGQINGGSWLDLTRGAAYLLFLKRVDESVFEPLSGPVWPTDSVIGVKKPTGEDLRPPPPPPR
jgi:hypothetical protein